ncbi:MAG: lytic transglycosylase domain-containing protein [Chthoniobacter sp.]|nr:lytic transglycosylase domain-containing protein [Chthoniobacter sp.]
MIRFCQKVFLLVFFAALTAAGLVLWTAPDPTYKLHAWWALGRFSAYDALISDAARKHRLDPLLVKAMVWRESAFDPSKVGTSGERGLMQVGEAAAQDWARAEKIETFVPTDLFDAKTNLEVGTWYFKKALEHWKGRDQPVPFALAEYNAGHARVERWLATTARGDEATAAHLLRVIEYPTTRRYIEDITARQRFYEAGGR